MNTEMIVAELIACGVSAGVIANVSVALACNARVEEIREQAAERQRRKRFRDRHATSRDALPPETPNQNNTPEKTSSSSPPRGRIRRGMPFPETWTLSEADRAYAVEKGLTEPEIAEAAARFATFWRSKPEAQRQWLEAWRYHVNNYPPRRPQATQPRPAARRRGSAAFAVLQAKLAERQGAAA